MKRKEEEKRKDFRWNILVPVRLVHLEKGWKVEGHTDNLSAGGCLMVVARGDPAPFEPGSLCEVDLGLPDGKVFLVSKVVRKSSGQDGKECLALEFVSVAKKDQDRIARFVLHAEVQTKRAGCGEETEPGGGGFQR